LRCFSQQDTQQRAALLGDVSQPLMASTGVFARDQSDIAGDLLAALEPLLQERRLGLLDLNPQSSE
jgi:hypothetical protein